jgi:microcystin-dependent protein
MAYLDYSGSTTGKSAFLDKIKVMLSEIYTSYIAQIDALAQTMGDTTDEVMAARDGEVNLLTQINLLQSLISGNITEVQNARDGESTLLAQIDSLQLSIAALAAGSGIVISSGDTTAGFADTKLLAGDYITATKGNAGANETLTFAGPALASQVEMETGAEASARTMSPLRVQQAIEQNIPSGVILLWSGSTATIPTGWAICDGTNGTPDLRNSFVVGAGDTYAVDATGGSTSHTHTDSLAVDSHTLTEAELAAHNHGFNYLEGTAGNTDLSTTNYFGVRTQDASKFACNTTNAVNTAVIGDTGSDTAHDHALSGSVTSTTTLPPYYALAYIMKL